jgi:hypothetical protein
MGSSVLLEPLLISFPFYLFIEIHLLHPHHNSRHGDDVLELSLAHVDRYPNDPAGERERRPETRQPL